MEYKIMQKMSRIPSSVISEIEKKKNAFYVGDFCVKQKSGNWSEIPVAIFWQKTPPMPEYSNYFGIYRDLLKGSLMITDGSSAAAEPFSGIASKTGEVVYSSYRHDFTSLPNGGGSIDGGRGYLRVVSGVDNVFPAVVELRIIGPDIVVTKVLSEPHQPSLPKGDAG